MNRSLHCFILLLFSRSVLPSFFSSQTDDNKKIKIELVFFKEVREKNTGETNLYVTWRNQPKDSYHYFHNDFFLGRKVVTLRKNLSIGNFIKGIYHDISLGSGNLAFFLISKSSDNNPYTLFDPYEKLKKDREVHVLVRENPLAIKGVQLYCKTKTGTRSQDREVGVNKAISNKTVSKSGAILLTLLILILTISGIANLFFPEKRKTKKAYPKIKEAPATIGEESLPKELEKRNSSSP